MYSNESRSLQHHESNHTSNTSDHDPNGTSRAARCTSSVDGHRSLGGRHALGGGSDLGNSTRCRGAKRVSLAGWSREVGCQSGGRKRHDCGGRLDDLDGLVLGRCAAQCGG